MNIIPQYVFIVFLKGQNVGISVENVPKCLHLLCLYIYRTSIEVSALTS